MSNSDLAERLKVVEQLTAVFRVERFTYLGVTLVAFFMLATSGGLMLLDRGVNPSELTLLFGSTGLLGYSGSQILQMWNRSLTWIGGQSDAKKGNG